jgi:hypothetical protein
VVQSGGLARPRIRKNFRIRAKLLFTRWHTAATGITDVTGAMDAVLVMVFPSTLVPTIHRTAMDRDLVPLGDGDLYV